MRDAGFSTIFWKIHGWDDFRAILSRTWGTATVVGTEGDDMNRQFILNSRLPASDGIGARKLLL